MSYRLNKYQNQKITLDGITFDSRLEAARYCELKLMARGGYIRNLQLQKPFELVPAFTKNKKKYRPITYVADFVYEDALTGDTVVEDTKGCKTEVYLLKKKLFEYRFPDLTIREVTHAGR